MKEVFLTGLRTNGEYHLGNYIGALLPLVRLINQKKQEYQINLFIADLHSFTTPINFEELYDQSMANLKLFVAAGIPLNNSSVNLYRQSYLPAHSELTWILSNFISFGDLSRMTEFKDKAATLKKNEQITAGLFIYPILMAVDILLYDARWVPIGEDQRQHLELCRRLARSFNQQFEVDVFTIPAEIKKQQEFFSRQEAPRIRNLRHPDKKMSKSIKDEMGTIMLSDTAELIEEKIMSATTDNFASINFNWQKQPGISNLLTILASLKNKPQAEVNASWQGSGHYKELKKAVIEAVVKELNKLQVAGMQVEEEALFKHLKEREEKLAQQANFKLAQVQKIIGLRK